MITKWLPQLQASHSAERRKWMRAAAPVSLIKKAKLSQNPGTSMYFLLTRNCHMALLTKRKVERQVMGYKK